MALSGKFIADFASFYDAVEKADVQLKTLGDGAGTVGTKLNRMVDNFSGRKVIQDATLMVDAIERIGGVSKLTEQELIKAGNQAETAASKMKALGMEVPKSLTDIADAAKKVPKPLEDTTKAGKDAGISMDSLALSASKVIAGWLTVEAVLGGLGAAWSTFTGFMSDSIAAAAGAEDSAANLTAALSAQDTSMPSVIAAYDGYAAALEKTTRYGDDVVQSAMGILVTVGDVMPRDMEAATLATANLAAALHKDLGEAATMVAKAATGSTKALEKYGIETTTAGGKTKDFAGIVASINEEFSGRAEAAANTYTGRIAQLGNAWDNVLESVGRAITSNQTVLTAIDLVTQGIVGNTTELNENQRVMNFISDAIIGTVKASALLLDAIALLSRQFAGMLAESIQVTKGLRWLVDNMIWLTEAAANLGQTAAKQALPKMQLLRDGMTSFVEAGTGGVKVLRDVRDGAQALSGKASELAKTLETTRGKTADLVNVGAEVPGVLNRGTTSLKDQTDAAKKAAEALKKYEEALRAIVDELSGGGAIDKAHLWLQALERTIPVSEMTREAQDKINKVLTDALAAYRALGQDAPAAVLAIWGATVKAIGPMESWADTVARFAAARDLLMATPMDMRQFMPLPTPLPTIEPQVDATEDWLRALQQVENILGGIQDEYANLAVVVARIIGEIIVLMTSVKATTGDWIGLIIAGVVALYGAVHALVTDEAWERVNDLRDDFLEARGGLAAFHQELVRTLGPQGEFLAQNLLSARTTEAWERAVKAATDALAEHERQVEEVKADLALLGTNLNAIVDVTARTAEELQTVGVIALASFNAAMEAGYSFAEALQMNQDGLAKLAQSFLDLGIPIENAALQAVLFQSAILDRNPQLLEAVGALGSSMEILNRLGLLNIETFAAMEETGIQMYTRLQGEVAAVGGTTKDALLPMQGYLHEAEKAAKELGIPLDDNTQMLIDQSKELGIWKESGKTANEKLLEGINKLIDRMNEFILTIGKVPKTIDVKGQVHWDVPPVNAPAINTSAQVPSFATGTQGKFLDFGTGTLAMLHGREAVVPFEGRPTAGPPLLAATGPVAAAPPVVINLTIHAEGAFFDTPGSLQKLADKVNAALTAKYGMTHRMRAA